MTSSYLGSKFLDLNKPWYCKYARKKNKNRVFTPLPKGVEGRGEETSDTLDYSLPRVVVTVMVSLSFPTPAIVYAATDMSYVPSDFNSVMLAKF